MLQRKKEVAFLSDSYQVEALSVPKLVVWGNSEVIKNAIRLLETLMATIFLWKTLIVTGLSDLGALAADLKPLTALSDQSIIIHPSSK